MSRSLVLLAGAVLLASGAHAQSSQSPAAAAGYTQLFMSPCGEPYRAKAGEPYPVAIWFRQTDANHDGAIDRAEFRADHAGFFDALDQDANGVLDGPEVSFYENRVAPDVFHPELFGLNVGPILVQYQPQGSINEPRRRQPREYVGAAAYGLLAEAEPVRAADSDLNGRVSKQEFQEAADRRFARLDKNADGKLEMAELPMTAVQARGAS
jgi:hypothetical protein